MTQVVPGAFVVGFVAGRGLRNPHVMGGSFRCEDACLNPEYHEKPVFSACEPVMYDTERVRSTGRYATGQPGRNDHAGDKWAERRSRDGGRSDLSTLHDIPSTELSTGYLYGANSLFNDQVGESTENPFEGAANDVPISQISRLVEIELGEMLGETDLPPLLQGRNEIIL